MGVLHMCMLVLTVLLLLCEVAVSHFCKSLINMVDGFHLLFILMHMALPLPRAEGASPQTRLSSFVSPPPASSSSSSSSAPLSSPPSSPPVTSTPTESSIETLPTTSPPPALSCGLSYTHVRIQTVGALISALLLASLCVSYCIEILSHTLQPHPIQRPLLAMVVAAVSLLHKLLLLGLSWGRLPGSGPGAVWRWEAGSALGLNRKVEAEEDRAEQGCVAMGDVSRVPSAADGSLHNGTLVLCNPGTSSVPDGDSPAQTQKPPSGARSHMAAPQGVSSGPGYQAQTVCSRDCEVQSIVADLKAFKCDAYSNNYFTEMSKGSGCMGRLDNQHAPETSPIFRSDQYLQGSVGSGAQWPGCVPSLLPVTRTLLTSSLALLTGLVLLLISPDCLHSSLPCSLLVYLDPVLSLVAVVVLLAAALPQVYRYGLLLLQAVPPQICVSDLGRRIASVPGVQAVHDLHIWQLTDSCTVASVHVHCHAGFQTHRCVDVTSGVTKVLQSVGVSCCTVQPEFPPCAGKMCCSPSVAEESRQPAAPSAGETEEEPHMLVIENTFL
ncbi:uncharacterized protein LOC139933728 [Centroberyx gerrardi]|uniref:uncharacterized protein n=1 Tax=Centroberyx gerrardi TaxID=166262 RepID=UPI003AAB4179